MKKSFLSMLLWFAILQVVGWSQDNSNSIYKNPNAAIPDRVLDLLGDLALTGAPLVGRVTGHRPRHDLNNMLVAAIMQRPQSWERVTLEPTRPTGAHSAQP